MIMKSILLLFSGFSIGIWLSWPGILIFDNWFCFNDIVSNSLKDKISIKAVLAVSPNYFLKGNKKNTLSRIRIVSDACFR